LNREQTEGRSAQTEHPAAQLFVGRADAASLVLGCVGMSPLFWRMKIVAAIHSSEAIRKILDCLGLPVRAPPIAKPSPDGPIEEPIIF
jgi:hypothetical protein